MNEASHILWEGEVETSYLGMGGKSFTSKEPLNAMTRRLCCEMSPNYSAQNP